MLVDFDMNTLPKSTPKAARQVIADFVELTASLRQQLQDANALLADKAIASTPTPKPRYDRAVFLRVNVRTRKGGQRYYNCQLAGELPSGSHAASKALGHPVGDVQRDSDGAPKITTDRNGGKWINLIPTTTEVAA